MVRRGLLVTSLSLGSWLSFVGCVGKDANPPMASSIVAPADAGAIVAITKTTWYGRDANELFDTDHVPRIEFTLPADKWQWLNDHALLEKYVQADATYEGQPAGTAGIRFKGSYGTLNGCLDTNGKLTCSKLSLKVNFEEYETNNRFYGLKRLNLHSMVRDPTKLHEKISYELYRLNGLQAPRSAWVNVTVNGKDYGLFSMVEDVDGRFVQDRWPSDGDGNLYKEAWPESTQPGYYINALETNTKAPDNRAILDFAQEFTAAADAASGAAVLGKWTDLDYWYRYMAVDDAIFNCDGITAIYAPSASGAAWGNHNYFLYNEPIRNKFWLIVWDLDATLTMCSDFASIPHFDQTPADCQANYSVWGGTWVKPPGCDRIFQALATDMTRYRSAVDQLLAGPFQEQTVVDKIDKWSDFIRSSVAADPTGSGDASWTSSVAELKVVIPLLRQRLEALRDGTPIPPLTLTVPGLNGFESATAIGVKSGLNCNSSPNTDCVFALNSIDPLAGQQDIRLDFVYRDPVNVGATGWQQWISYSFPFAEAYQDLTPMKRLRVLMRADKPRSVRIDFDSDLYQAANTGIRFGFDAQVTDQLTALDLSLDTAQLPSWATGVTDVWSKIRTHVSRIEFSPSVLGRDTLGNLGPNIVDSGYLEIDDVEFVAP